MYTNEEMINIASISKEVVKKDDAAIIANISTMVERANPVDEDGNVNITEYHKIWYKASCEMGANTLTVAIYNKVMKRVKVHKNGQVNIEEYHKAWLGVLKGIIEGVIEFTPESMETARKLAETCPNISTDIFKARDA